MRGCNITNDVSDEMNPLWLFHILRDVLDEWWLTIIGIKNELSSGDLHIIPKRGLPIVTQWRLIWLKNKKMSPVAQAYLEFIKQHKTQIFERHLKWSDEY